MEQPSYAPQIHLARAKLAALEGDAPRQQHELREAARTAAAIGPRAWKILHTVGSYYIWLIFANSYVSRAVMDTGYLPMAAIVVGALALRIVAAVAKARSRQALPEKGQTA